MPGGCRRRMRHVGCAVAVGHGVVRKLVRVDGTNGTVSLGFAVAAFDDADVAVFLADDGGGGQVVSAGVGRVSLVHDRLRPLREPLQEASTSDGR